jgi:hypothetical protein
LKKPASKAFCIELKNLLEIRFKNFGTKTKNLALANFLDPNYKDSFFREFDALEEIKRLLVQELSKKKDGLPGQVKSTV